MVRIKSNHKYVPADSQDRFQKLIEIVLRSNLSEDEFNTTVDLIINEFPNTSKWVKWHLENDRGPLIFPSISNGYISGYGKDTNGQEGIGGWIQRSYGTSRPNLVQGLQHLVRMGIQVEEDLKSSKVGSSTRYGKPNSPDERAQTSLIKKKTKRLMKSDGRPPDTSKDAPAHDQECDLSHMIPWSFRTVTPFSPHVQLHVTNTCPMDTTLMALFLIRKFYSKTVPYFVSEGASLNAVLNYINEKKYDDACIMRITHLLNQPGINKAWIVRQETTDNGNERWDCFGAISHQYLDLKMVKFWEEDNIGVCSICNETNKTPVQKSNKGQTHAEDVGDEIQVLEMPKNPKRKTRQGNRELSILSLEMKDMQRVLNDQYNPHGLDQVHCNVDGCKGVRSLTTKMVVNPVILVIEPMTTSYLSTHWMERCPLLCMNDIEHELIIHEFRYVLVQVMLHSGNHFRGVSVINDKYVLYDGLLPKMRFIDGNEQFSEGAGGDFIIGSLWYLRTRNRSSLPSQVMIKVEPGHQVVPDDKAESDDYLAGLGLLGLAQTTTESRSTKKSVYNSKQEKRRTPSKRTRTPKVKFSPSDYSKPIKKKVKYPTGMSIAEGAKLGSIPTCKHCRGMIMRNQVRAIKKVKRFAGLGYDIQQYHFYCVKKAINSCELQQLMDVIKASDYDLGSKSAWASKINAVGDSNDIKGLQWMYEMDK